MFLMINKHILQKKQLTYLAYPVLFLLFSSINLGNDKSKARWSIVLNARKLHLEN